MGHVLAPERIARMIGHARTPQREGIEVLRRAVCKF